MVLISQWKKNKPIAILGNTGSGKSTILSLLTRIHDVNGNSKIKIDGIRIKRFRFKSFKK